ncbi:MAG TPA: hypothetical protein VFY37_01785 [Solirubrobacterales bacterium]|nr:hypothetical protein [Solirubrobacterales bacterium]
MTFDALSYAIAGAGVLAVAAVAMAALRRVDWALEFEQGASRAEESSEASEQTVAVAVDG